MWHVTSIFSTLSKIPQKLGVLMRIFVFVRHPMSTIEILVLHPKCSKYSFELSKLIQTRTLEKHFFSSTRRRQKSLVSARL